MSKKRKASKPPPLPYESQPFETARARLQEALTPHYDVQLVHAGKQPQPGSQRKHVLDFPAGIRVVASVDYDGEDIGEPQKFIHLSFGLQEEATEADDEAFSDNIFKLLVLFFGEVPEHEQFCTARAVHFMFKLPEPETVLAA